jgi:hypothetical protein
MGSSQEVRLDIAVGLLTRPSKHRIIDAEGNAVWVTADPLLVQLALAVQSSSAAPAFKASTAAGIPMDAVAHDLLERIRATVVQLWWQTHQYHHGHGRGAKVAPMLRAWAAAVRADPELLDEAVTITEGWAAEIAGLFKPHRAWEVRGWCPKCHARRVIDHDEDGGRITKPALEITFDADGHHDGARCHGCGNRWDREEVIDLARFVANQPDDPENVSRETAEE